MTTLTITLELPTDAELADEANDNLIATWGEFKRILPYWLPASDGLEIRKGLDGTKIQKGLRIGKLTVDVTDPYVEPPKRREFAPGTIAHTTAGVVVYVKNDGEGWTANYVYTNETATRSDVGDKTVEGRLADGTATIIFDPTQN